MTLQVGVRVRHKTFGEGVIAHGPIWAEGQDGRPGRVFSGPEHDMGSWELETALFVVEFDEAVSAPVAEYGDDSQLSPSRAWLFDESCLEEVEICGGAGRS